MSVEVMQAQLRRLMLGTAARELETVLAKHKKSVSLDWVSDLLERELDSRKANGIQKRIELVRALVSRPRLLLGTRSS